MTPQEIFAKLTETLGAEVVFDLHADPKKEKDPWFQVAPASIVKVCTFLRDDPDCQFQWMECMTGTDYPKEKTIHVTLHLYSYEKKHRVVLKCFLPREEPKMPTISGVWPVANWHERECFDLLGVVFEGHPDLRRILLPEDWEGYPLRKDYKEADSYHGIPTTRPIPLELLTVKLAKKEAPVPEPAKA